MKRYTNLNGRSGVLAYDATPTAIIVEFQRGDKYEYTHGSAGADAVEKMKRLAKAGAGLSSYIARHRPVYLRKWP